MVQAANILNYQTPCGTTSDSTLHVNCVDRYETSAAWNYGANFGGPTKSSWTSGKVTDRAMYGVRKEGMFGNSFVGDSAYSTSYGGTGIQGFVTMCQGNTTGTHPTWCQ